MQCVLVPQRVLDLVLGAGDTAANKTGTSDPFSCEADVLEGEGSIRGVEDVRVWLCLSAFCSASLERCSQPMASLESGYLRMNFSMVTRAVGRFQGSWLPSGHQFGVRSQVGGKGEVPDTVPVLRFSGALGGVSGYQLAALPVVEKQECSCVWH